MIPRRRATQEPGPPRARPWAGSPDCTTRRAVFDFSGLSGLGQAGKPLQNYLGFAQRVDRLVSGWAKPFEGVFERLRRATEFYPRDPDGQPIPPWNIRLYRLARAAYRADDYEAQARFLDEIGADGSVDKVLLRAGTPGVDLRPREARPPR